MSESPQGADHTTDGENQPTEHRWRIAREQQRDTGRSQNRINWIQCQSSFRCRCYGRVTLAVCIVGSVCHHSRSPVYSHVRAGCYRPSSIEKTPCRGDTGSPHGSRRGIVPGHDVVRIYRWISDTPGVRIPTDWLWITPTLRLRVFEVHKFVWICRSNCI